jgi:hypothetical protein
MFGAKIILTSLYCTAIDEQTRLGPNDATEEAAHRHYYVSYLKESTSTSAPQHILGLGRHFY